MEIPRRIPEPGQTLKGRYSLGNLLGEGGFAKTFKGKDIPNDRDVAVKVLKLNPTAKNIGAFSQEVVNMLLLQHAQILSVTDYEAQEKGVLPYLVTEYAPLGSLQDYVRRRGQRLGIEESISLLEQASWGIGYAHDTKNLVHRDIKPENLLLLDAHRLVVADFGIAKQLNPNVSLTTEQFSGTVPYAAPEQFQGKAVKASDQYALGVTTFFVLTGGKLPFSGDMLEMFMKKTKGESISLVQAIEGLKRGERMWTILTALDPVVHQAIDPEAHKRHGHITQFTRTLRDRYSDAVTEKPDKTVHPVTKPLVQQDQEVVLPQPQAGFPQKGRGSQKPTVPVTPSELVTGGQVQKPQIQESPIKPQVPGNQPSQPLQQFIPPLQSVPTPSADTRQSIQSITPQPDNAPILPTPNISIYPVSQQQEPSNPNVLQTPNIVVPRPPRISRRNALILLGTAGTTVAGIVAINRALNQSIRPEITPTPTTTKEIRSGSTLEIYRGHSNNVNSVAWSPDGSKIASGSADYTVQVWYAATGKLLTDYKGHSSIVGSVAWSPDGSKIASAGDYTAQVWDASSGKLLTDYTGHSDGVNSVAWSPDGSKIASGSADNTVQVWYAATGKLLTHYTGHSNAVNSVAWSPDGSKIASGSGDYTAQVWYAATGKLLTDYTGHSRWVNSVAWSPDGSKIASGSGDNTAQVWYAATGKLLTDYTGHSNAVNSVAWSPDGSKIASGSIDKTVQIWEA